MIPAATAVPLPERRLAPVERLHRAGSTITASFEFFPPKTPALARGLEETIDRLLPLDPTFVSVTYGAGGTTREETFDTAVALRRHGLRVAAHLTCVAHSRAEIRAIVEGYRDAGIDHILALRGDLPDGVTAPPDATLAHASDLVAELRAIGIERVAVAAFPEGHPETGFDLDAEIENLKRKEAAGATEAITQFCLENDTILRFVDRARAAGIALEIIPGILPVANVAQTRSFAAKVGASVPDWLDGLFEGLDDDPATRDLVAASVAAEQCADLAAHGLGHVHFYTLNRAPLTYAVCRLLGIRVRL
jgi:methylenetetrahydrofolate reductase (NADPH)